jgi:hypothetical protein
MKFQLRLFHFFVILFSLAFFFIQSGDYGLRLDTQLVDIGDSVLNAWILAWDAHALLNPGVFIWDAPIFFPAKGALAFSENLIGNLWITLPVQLLTDNYVLAANMLAVFSFVLGSYFVFLLVKELTGSSWGGLAAGLIFSFNPYRWGQLVHLQLMPFFWAPLALLFANRFLNTKNFRDFWAALLFTWFQYYASVYLGTMLLTLLISLFLVHLVLELRGRERLHYFRDRNVLKHFFTGALASSLVLLPIGIPYLKVALKWDFFRTINENVYYSADILGFLFPSHVYSNYNWLKDVVYEYIKTDRGESAVFIGFLPYFLAALAVWFLQKKYDYFSSDQKKIIVRYAAVSTLMALIMLGPFLFIPGIDSKLPMPFFFVYKFIPGGSAMRVPARFAFPYLLTLSVLCGFGISLIIKILKERSIALKSGAVAFLIIFLLFEYQINGIGSGDLKLKDDYPEVYRYIQKYPQKGPVLELPINRISKFMYLHYQVGDWRPRIGGFSGWEPPFYGEMRRRVKKCSDESCYKLLKLLPLQTLVVHLDKLDFYERIIWQKANLKKYGFNGPQIFGSDLVWERVKSESNQETSKLKVSSMYLTSDNFGAVAIFNFRPDGKNSWRSFSEKMKFDFAIETNDGKKVVVHKDLKNPHFILPNDSIDRFTGIFTRLGVEVETIKSIEIKGPEIISKNYAQNDLVFFKPPNQSRSDKGPKINFEIGALRGIKNHDSFKQGQKFRVITSLKNMGEDFWLDLKSNAELYDTVNGSVFFTTSWYKSKNKDSCRFDEPPVKESRAPIESIIAPEESANFYIHEKAPDQIGKYRLVFGLSRKSQNGFDKIENFSPKCVNISVKEASNPYSYGNLARFFKMSTTAEGKISIEEFEKLSRDEQVERIVLGAEIINNAGGPKASKFNPKDLHLRQKVLEIAEFMKTELKNES